MKKRSCFQERGALVRHAQDNLAPHVPFRSLFIGLARLGKGEHRVDDRSKLSRVNECTNLDQLLPVGFDDEPDKAHVKSLCHISRRWGTNDGDQHSSWFDHLPGALQGVATNRIKDEVDIMNHVLEARGGVIDELIGSQFAQEITIACRSGRNDICACLPCQLDGEDANAACASVDQDSLPRDQARVFKEALPGCQGLQRNRCGLYRVERAWFGSQFAREGNGVVSFGAVPTIVQHGIDLCSFGESGHARAYLHHHS